MPSRLTIEFTGRGRAAFKVRCLKIAWEACYPTLRCDELLARAFPVESASSASLI